MEIPITNDITVDKIIIANSFIQTPKQFIIFEVLSSENKSKKNALSFINAEQIKIYKTGDKQTATRTIAKNNPIVFFITNIAPIIAPSESETYPPTTGTALEIVYFTPFKAIFSVVYDADWVSLIIHTNSDANIPINQFKKFNKTSDILLICKSPIKSERDKAVHTDIRGRKIFVQRNWNNVINSKNTDSDISIPLFAAVLIPTNKGKDILSMLKILIITLFAIEYRLI